MTPEQSIDDYITAIRTWGGATPRFGPAPPSGESSVSPSQLDEVLAQYPFLMRDPAYAQFLARCDGVYYEHPDQFRVLSIPGFTHLAKDILANGYSLVDDAGFCQIASFQFIPAPGGRRDMTTHAYYLDASGERAPGVYRGIVRGRSSTDVVASPPVLCCSSFLEFLRLLVEHQGQLP